ncbi:biotin-dependent carboxyltransferase family protein [Shewanella waksmanii]|uniref:5-oxoprolinase subunit C family protein n=1 Tax=Shewanella waksmanii TaxID=213783 RepID=UPI00048D1322|nr:biotin-dependent carboxyltransferase family protein [Shewanella waksmanii]
MLLINQLVGMATIQDLGRYGYGHLGVAQCGAIDRQALLLANKLLNNLDDCAAIEFTASLTVTFNQDCWFTITGAPFIANIAQRNIWHGWRNRARKGETLTIMGPKQGRFGYLAVEAGFRVDSVMASASTDINSGFGGLNGRLLQAGDQIGINPSNTNISKPVGAVIRQNNRKLRALPGPELQHFTPQSRQAFWQQHWQVSDQSNRMGYRLSGETLQTHNLIEMRSHGVMPGVVQIPPTGEPIVLMADAQATGGYPRIATVIEADLWKLAQCQPSDHVQFEHVSPAQADEANQEWQRYFYRLQRAMNHHG